MKFCCMVFLRRDDASFIQVRAKAGERGSRVPGQDKAQANWHRREPIAWGDGMLARFEADTGDRWTTCHVPLTGDEEDGFKRALRSWFERSEFANQGIHIEHIVFDPPDLSR